MHSYCFFLKPVSFLPNRLPFYEWIRLNISVHDILWNQFKWLAYSKLFERSDQFNLSFYFVDVDQIFPNLEELGLSVKDIMMLLQGDFPQDRLFGSLKDMEVRDDDSASVPNGLLEKFPRLENLNLSFCSYKELFSNEGQVHLIKKLELICLNDLECLWIPNSNMGDSILQNLEILKVQLCQNLISLIDIFPFSKSD